MKTIKRSLTLIISFVLFSTSAQAVIISETHINVTCFGGNDGSIDITPSGGAAPYTFLWNGGITTEDRTGIPVGTYTVVVTDNIGTTASVSIAISEPSEMSFSKSIINVFCGGDSTGHVDLTVNGGTPGYTYLWYDGVTTEDRHFITAANYYFTVTDSRGCTKDDSANVTQPPGMVTTISSTDEECTGSNGTIDLTVQYGIPGYSYLWSDGTTTQDRTGVPSGTYTVTISDNSTCTVSASAVVGLTISPMSINTTSTNPTCMGGNDGAITITSVIGSVSPYTYLWNDGATTQNRTGLGAGSYTVTATSANGCTASTSESLTVASSITITLTQIPVSCFGGNNGAINTTRSGGTSPYTYLWNDGAFTQNRTGLSAGTYSITITDFAGCTASASVSVIQPSLALTATAIPSPLACIGGPSGSVVTSVTGGTGPYTYWWGGGVVSQNRINVAAGTYCVTATDANGCSANACATIPGYTPLSVFTTRVDVTCFGDSTGSIDVTASNGTTPYSYLWSTGETTEDLNMLKAGTYIITVTDNNSCTMSRTVTISQPSFPVTINSTVSNPQCYGSNDGSILISTSNGVSPYSYMWNDSVTTQNRLWISYGNFLVTVTDNSGCSASATMTVTEPTPMVIVPSVIDVTCNGASTGAINLSVTGSFAPYAYDWSDGGDTQNRSGIIAGNYTVTIVDNHNCTGTASATVTEPTPVVISLAKEDVTCFGGNDGWINTVVSGGTPAYSFDWGGGITTQNRTNLTANNYSVSITDNAGCLFVASTTVSEPVAISISSATTGVACNGGNDGTITLFVTGGTSPYSFDWGGGITTQSRTNLIAGSYSVTITDSANCTSTHTATVAQSTMLNVSSTITDASCSTANNGAININVTGGTVPYSFLWNDNQVSQNITNLSAGTYTVTVTDNAGCTAVNTSTVSALPGVTIISAVTDATCSSLSNGAINIAVSGGAAPYSFGWNDGVTTQNRAGILPGAYSVSVTDFTGCNATHSATVTSPAEISVTATTVDVLCNGTNTGSISIIVSGGVSPYSFVWNDGVLTQNRNSVSAGNYFVTVMDSSSCSASASATVSEPTVIGTVAVAVSAFCFGSSDGSIDLTVNGGVGPYLFSWSNSSVSEDLNGIPAGNYLVNITDANNCVASTSATVSQPSQMLLSTTQTHVGCASPNSGSIDLTVTGGVPGYTYVWNNSQTTQNLSNLTVGNYSVTVMDNNFCSAVASASVVQSPPLVLSETHTHVSCSGANDGTITIGATGGVTPYSYDWGGTVFTYNRTSLSGGYYSVTVSDNSSCTATIDITINEPYPISLMVFKVDASCTGQATGRINLTVIGGTAGYSFSWNDGYSTQNRTNLLAGSYTVTLTDANSCTATTGQIIVYKDSIITTYTKSDVTCSTGSNGSVDLSITGGTAPYAYNWNNTYTTQDISNLNADTYMLTATDFNGCSTTNSVVITEPGAIQITFISNHVSCYGGSNGSVDITVTGGSAPYTFLWNNTRATEDVSLLATGNYRVTVTDANLCSVVSSYIPVNQPSPISASSTVVDEGCVNRFDGQISVNVSGGTPPYTYLWNDSNTSQNRINLGVGNYQLTITDFNGCTSARSDTVRIISPISITGLTESTPCPQLHDGSIDISVTGGTSPYIFNWSNGSSYEDISSLSSGNYTVTVTDIHDCTTQAGFTISYSYDFELSAQVEAFIDAGETIQLTVNPSADFGNTYLWTPEQQLSCPICPTTEATPQTTTYYHVIVTDSNGCYASATVVVNVKPGTDIFIPNAFTPNNDGINDFLELYGDKNGIAFLDFAVFNRWGEKVFQSNNQNFTWNGVYKGEVVPPGVYVYVMKTVFEAGVSVSDIRGSITVIR